MFREDLHKTPGVSEASGPEGKRTSALAVNAHIIKAQRAMLFSIGPPNSLPFRWQVETSDQFLTYTLRTKSFLFCPLKPCNKKSLQLRVAGQNIFLNLPKNHHTNQKFSIDSKSNREPRLVKKVQMQGGGGLSQRRRAASTSKRESPPTTQSDGPFSPTDLVVVVVYGRRTLHPTNLFNKVAAILFKIVLLSCLIKL